MPRKLLKFLIIFDNTSLLYFPGQFLSGKVLMELQDDTPVLGLHFHVVGEGVVRVGSGRNERLFDKENYIDFRMRLLGEPGQGAMVLSPGIHSFPFKLGLPLGLPSTFLGAHGWVQYYCRAALREPHRLTHKNQQVFVVMNPIDLNVEPPILQQELECAVEHVFGGCAGGGAVRCRVVVARGAFVPGERVPLRVHTVNHSRVALRSTRATLTETIQYMAHGKVAAMESRALAVRARGKLRPGDADEWRDELTVPPLPPTNLRGCHLISLRYDVYVVLEPGGLDKPVKLQLPLVIGTYPYREQDAPPPAVPPTLPLLRPHLTGQPREY